ncbi:metal ABC transporter permease [Lachnoclostridium sp. Marseille-P6806]|uniref:metal ABC transporter permease n=1 Tax=Lachnoclostridium sp. Marseille-P6806 TaxID=2364793 RepID=UPI0010320B6D|nr:metal ABC transporter permease [Lachnoclostridium sp. Marseille-P6806]
MLSVLWTLIATALACGVLGPFLVLRRASMIADALSHSILLGIVLAFMLAGTLDSPALVLGAALFGILTVALVELLEKSGLVAPGDALGVVFPLFFSLAVIIITKYFRNAHLDVDMVLMGNPLFAPFIRVFGIPRAMLRMLLMLAVNLGFILSAYRPLKISTFDPEFAKLTGIRTGPLHGVLMLLTALTCVLAFDSVGSILVISMFAAPAACACMVTKRLSAALLLTAVFSSINAGAGYAGGMLWNVSVSGMCSVSGLALLLVLMLFRRQGLLRTVLHTLRLRFQRSPLRLLIPSPDPEGNQPVRTNWEL